MSCNVKRFLLYSFNAPVTTTVVSTPIPVFKPPEMKLNYQIVVPCQQEIHVDCSKLILKENGISVNPSCSENSDKKVCILKWQIDVNKEPDDEKHWITRKFTLTGFSKESSFYKNIRIMANSLVYNKNAQRYAVPKGASLFIFSDTCVEIQLEVGNSYLVEMVGNYRSKCEKRYGPAPDCSEMAVGDFYKVVV